MKKCVCMTVCIAFIVLFAAPFGFGQALDDLWFQAKINIKGYTVDSDGLLNKISGNVVNYIHTTWIADTNYNIVVYDGDGNVMPGASTFTTIGANDYILPELGHRFGEGSNYIDAFQTSLITIKRDSQGTIKSAAFNSMGCEVKSGSVDGNAFFGGCVMKAKTTDPSKLPFTPTL